MMDFLVKAEGSFGVNIASFRCVVEKLHDNIFKPLGLCFVLSGIDHNVW